MLPEEISGKDRRPIPPDEVHVWWTTLDLPAADTSQIAALLSDEERARARRLIHGLHRQRFTVAHAVLRILLSGYLKTLPEKIEFEYNRYGKPSLAASAGPPPLFFNLSHSQGIALFGVCQNRNIGVDIEHIRPIGGMIPIVRRYFSEQETEQILTMPLPKQKKMFFQYWSMKEAGLKAIGHGLRGLKQVRARQLNDRRSIEAVIFDSQQHPWSIRPLKVLEGYAAAVAIDGSAPWKALCRRWRP